MIIRTVNSIIADGKCNNVKFQTVGEKHTPMLTFSLAYAKDLENPKQYQFLNCKCFYENAKNWSYLQKGMNILVAGERKIETYKEKEQETCFVSFIANPLQFAVEEEQPEVVSENKSESNDTLPF